MSQEAAVKPRVSLADTVHQAMHDLRGPMVNIHGFVGELGMATADLVALAERYQDALPDEFSRALRALVDDDISPCLDYLKQSARQFEESIDELPQLFRSAD